MVLTLLFGTTNEYRFSFILGFQILIQILSNCMRKLSIVDCFGFCIQFFPSIVSRNIPLKQSEISGLYSFFSYYFYTSIFNPSTE